MMKSLLQALESTKGEGTDKIRQLFFTILSEKEKLKVYLFSQHKEERHEARSVILTFFRLISIEIAKEKNKPKEEIFNEVFSDPKLSFEDLQELHALIDYCLNTTIQQSSPSRKKSKKKFFA